LYVEGLANHLLANMLVVFDALMLVIYKKS